MRGEQLHHAFVGFAGVYGDRVYAFHSSAAPKGFPYLTAREQQEMLRYRPYFRNSEQMTKPPNLDEAEALPPGVTPSYPDATEFAVDVETPAGETVAVDDPRLINMLHEGLRDTHALTLHRSDRAMTDCRPISLFSLQTARQIGDEVGVAMDKRRFRANLYVDLGSADGFSENQFVGHSLRIGAKAVISVLDRDPRCKMITLDPGTAVANPEIMKRVARGHDGTAGVYAAVMVEGTVNPGDEIVLLN
jgi:hypothetical protein